MERIEKMLNRSPPFTHNPFTYLNFRVLMAIRLKIAAMIQNRTITFGSGHPLSSK
jgi:hypothetical protein